MLPGDAGIMEDFLARLAGRALGILPVLRPVPLPVWAPPMLSSEAAWETAGTTPQTPRPRPATVPAEGARSRGGLSVAPQADGQPFSPGLLAMQPAPILELRQGQGPALPLPPGSHQEEMQEIARDTAPGKSAVSSHGHREEQPRNWLAHASPDADDSSPVAEGGKHEPHTNAPGLTLTTPAPLPDTMPQAASTRMVSLAPNAHLTESSPHSEGHRLSYSTESSARSGQPQRQAELEGRELLPTRGQGRPGVVSESDGTVPDFSIMRPAHPPAPRPIVLSSADSLLVPGADLADPLRPGKLPPLPRLSRPMDDSERPGQSQHEVGAEPAEPRGAQSRPTAPAAPTIRVTIGRIEVRAVSPAPRPAPASRPARPQPALSLEAYLQQRAEQRR